MSRPNLKEYFHFTRGQQRGALMLFIILLGALVTRFIVSYQKDATEGDFSEFEVLVRTLEGQSLQTGIGTDTASVPVVNSNPRPYVLQPFDPNLVARKELLNMRLPGRLVNAWVNYRNAGAIFFAADDLRRIYGMDSLIFERLLPFLVFENPEASQPAYVPVRSPDPEKPLLRIELNGADSVELLRVWGIGPVFASRIIKYRDLLGGYFRLEQLQEVYGMKKEAFDTIKKQLAIDTTGIRKMDLLTVSEYQLRKHPYLDAYQSKAIVSFRNYYKGNFTLLQLAEQNLIPAETYNKVRPYFFLGDSGK